MSLKSTVEFIVRLLSNKKFRDAYVAEQIRNGIPFQIRALRMERGWTQAELGKRSDKKQHGISRLENPNLGDELSIKSLLDIASAFDVALLIKFVPFSKLLKECEDVSPRGLSVKEIGDERKSLLRWATIKDKGYGVKDVDFKTTPVQCDLVFTEIKAEVLNINDSSREFMHDEAQIISDNTRSSASAKTNVFQFKRPMRPRDKKSARYRTNQNWSRKRNKTIESDRRVA